MIATLKKDNTILHKEQLSNSNIDDVCACLILFAAAVIYTVFYFRVERISYY